MNIRNRNMDETLEKLLEIVSRITKINKNEINIHENLVEMGMDSIVFTRINHSIIQHFGIEIPFSKVYEELTNLQKISGYLVEKTKSNSTLNKSVSSLSSGAPSGLAAAIETEVDEITSIRYKDIQKLITKAKSQTILNDEKRRSDERFIYEMPLTKEQESILVQNDFSSSAFNEAVALSIQGNIDKELLEESINIVVERHESLRTIINQDTKMQQILKDRPITLKVMNNYQLETNKVVNNFVNQPFDLAEGLFRAVLIEESENQFVFVIVIHHIIADGWSIGVLLSEITEVFNNIINDKILDMNEPLQFREFIQARDEWSNLNEEKGTLLREKYYSKTENFVDLNFNYKPKSKGYTGARLDLIDNNDILQQLRRISAKNKTSLFHTMLSSFIAFISRVSQNKHITVGVPFAGQNIMNAETLIGNCVEMIGVHLEVEETDDLNIVSRKVSEFLEELNETGFLHKNNSEQSYNVVFNMIKNVNNSFNGTECQFFPIGISESKYDLFLTIIEFNNQVIMRFDYNQEVISERTINRWACYFKNILNAKIKEDNTAVSEISIFSDEEVDSIHQLSAYSYDYINHKLKADLLQYGLAEGEEVKVFILDKNMMLLPIGMIGEIYIGPNNVEIYNTNHLGKLSDTGHLTILGEEDKQIVIKGRKVSLFTIEEHIRNIPVVKDVICEYDVQNSDLTAYVELGMPIKDSSELTLALRKSLPAFMIPTSFIKVDNLENKMDGELIGHYEQLTYTESELISIWKEILDVKNVNVEDDFFQLGGNSLKAMRVLARIQKDFNKTIQIKDLFFNPTVRHIASIIDAASVDEKEQIQLIKVSHEEYYPVSSVQKRMYMLNKIEPESLNYNISTAIRLEGQVNIERLKNSVNNIIKRHESLRTYFDEVNGTVVQKIEESLELNIEYSYKENFLNEDEFMDREISGFLKSFDLNKLPLFRVKILKLQRNLHIVLLDTHHIIFDGTSSGILLQELVADYNGLKLPELKVQYKDFVQWESQLNTKEERAKSESYWKDLFQENIPVLSIQTDYPRPVNQTFNGQIVSLVLDRKLSDQIEKYCSINKITPYMFFVATINILLAKYSGQEDIVLGTTIDGRNHPDLNNLIGMFVNTIPLRNKYEPNHTFNDFTNKVKENTLQAFEYSNYQFEDLIDLLDLKRDVSRNPLFDVLFTYQNNLVSHIESDDFEIRTYEIKKEGSKVDLFFEVLQDTEFTCNIEYNSDLFSEGTIKRMGLHFHSLIMRLLNQTSEELKNIEILTENESLELLETFNDTGAIYSTEKTIHQFFEEQVVQVPENTAVVFAGKRLSYRELNERANQIAWVLRDKGVKPDQTVGIMVERSLEMIVGILAILKAGGAYLPIDPTHPIDRIHYILENSGTKLLLMDGNLPEDFVFAGEILSFAELEFANSRRENLPVINTSRDLAYVIYTSGTTGQPKGVMIEHRSLVNRLNWMQKNYPLGERDVILQKTPYTFDVSVWELLWWTMAGAQMVFLAPKEEREPEKILEAIDRYGVTTMHFVPSMLHVFLDYLRVVGDRRQTSSLKQVFTSGEALKSTHANTFHELVKDVRLINLYGPTEATIDVTYFNCLPEDTSSIPIGRPIDNTKLYIMDRQLHLMPIGVMGELCISGDGLARGYLNNESLTAEKFVDHPYEPGMKLYRTGDLAKWLPDGNIEYLGRLDSQIKIRGFRIELGEVEKSLLTIDGIEDGVVVVKESEDDKYLVAYYLGNVAFSAEELRKKLKAFLPEYMIPAYFVKLDHMPMGLNGKINRKALPEPSQDSLASIRYEAPQNELQKKLVEIWSEVLRQDIIGMNDNFFEIGGHSLKATVVTNKIYQTLHTNVSLKEFFDHPTIGELSGYIQGQAKHRYEQIPVCAKQDAYATSSAQKRMYLVQQLERGTVYNMPLLFAVVGDTVAERIEETFQKLVDRHESLRTFFVDMDGEIVQKIHPELPFTMGRIEGGDREVESFMKDFVRPFSLEEAPLFRADLITIDEASYVMVDMHHIISDGVSMERLFLEFNELYHGKALEPLRIQYKDFAAWQNTILQSEELKQQESYWIQQFSDDIPVLNLPYDFKRPVMQRFEGDECQFNLGEKQTEALRAIANETGSTMHMVLMSAFHVLLSKYSGQEDIVIGTPVAGRPHAELQNMMGMFVNTIALRNYAGGGKTYLSFLEEVKQNSLLAYDNQSYQFEELIDKLQLNRDISRHPLFDVMFTMNHRDGLGVGISEGSLLKPMIQPSKQSKFDLTLHIIDGYQELKGSFEYATSLFKKETIERMVQHFKGILDNICEYKEIKISDIAMITEVEKQQITYAFNHKKVNFPRDKTIVQMFEEQVIKTPDRVAVKFKSQTFTYKELNQKSNQLAYILREKGISSESIVGIMVEKSMELVVGILAILKAGGAYLPIDPKIPDNRKEYIINDSELELLITSNGFISTNKELLTIDLEDIALNGPSDNLPLINKPKDLAYIIYTSGTTGNPKGVMVEHSNVVQLMANDKMPFSFSERDVWTMFHSPAFDFSVWEMYGALLYGGKLVIVPDLVAKETNKYLSLLKEEKVTVLNQTPTAFYNLLQQELQYRSKDLSLRYIIFGGEALKPSMLDGWQKKYDETKLINMYGITETTVHVTFKEIGIREIRDGASNIGNSLPTLKTLIVDKNLNVQPVGVPGELCVGGAGVTRGYLNREVLTKERFIKHPDFGNERFYRSGDLVKLLSNGEIEYLGRIDHQVKIRGFRIELGEIENRLISNEYVKEAVVLAKEDSQHQIYLCAYIVCHKALNKADIKSFLKERLPEYMIPTYFMEIDKIPLTNNGKVNRIALPEPDESGLISSDYEAPETANQKELVGIWKNILGVESIGIQDNFFDLGGHSLKATILISEIHKDLGIELPLKEVFMNPTIKELSKSLESAKKDTFETIKVYEDREYYETSSAQKRMYTFQNLDSTSTAYNMPGIFEIEGDVNRNQLENTFRQLIQRHEGLRTYFETIDGEIVQKIKPSYQFYLNRKVDQENDMTDIVKNFVRPFELDKGPLFRAELLENNKKKFLLIDMHHIISDGVSMSVLINELNKLYSGEFLEPLRIQYKDFAHWQNNLLKSGGLDKQEAFWKKQFEGNIPVLHLPYDYERPSKKSFIGETLHFDLGRESSLQIRILAKEQGVSLHMLLLSAFNILLSKYSGQEDIITGVPVAGRPHVDLQNIMGMFVNTLALRTYPNKDKSVRKFIEEVKESSLQAYDNQSYQLEELISAINIVRDKGRNPLFDVLFDMDNQDVNSDIKLNEVTLKPKKFESDVAKFDLTLVGIDRQENIEMYFEYSSMLFKRKTIERAISDLKTILKSMVEDIDKPLKSISIHTEEEIEILLKEEENLDSISDQDFAFDF